MPWVERPNFAASIIDNSQLTSPRSRAHGILIRAVCCWCIPMPSHNPESRYHRPHARAGNLFEDPPTNKPAVASGLLSSKDPDASPCPRHMLQEATCCTENGNATTWISNLPTQLSATGLVLSSWVWTPSGPRPIVALPSPATVTRDTGRTSTGIGDAQLRIQVDTKETQCALEGVRTNGGLGPLVATWNWAVTRG